MAEPVTILVYSGLDLVGDGLMKLPFLRALRHAYPQAHITWLAGKGHTVYAGVLAPLVTGLIDEVIEEAGIGLAWRELLRRPLPDRRFDLVIDTQRRVKTTLILRRIRHQVFVSGAAGYRLSDCKPARYVKQRRMVDALLDLVAVASINLPPMGEVDRRSRAGEGGLGGHRIPSPSHSFGTGPSLPHRGEGFNSFDMKLKLDPAFRESALQALPHDNYIGLAPGAGGVHKRWPLERFIAMANEVVARGYIPVFLLGPDEADWQKALAEAVPTALFPALPSPLHTIAIAERLTLAIANDSGTGHMLAAADVPLISLFGPTDPAKFAPYVTRGIVIRAQDFGGEDMVAIPVSDVITAMQSIISS